MSGKARIVGFVLLLVGILILIPKSGFGAWINKLLNSSLAGYFVGGVLIIIGAYALFKRYTKRAY